MKIRLEVIDDDGKEKTSVEFGGRNWKEYLIKFIDSIDDTQPPSTESSFDVPAKQPDLQTAQPNQQSLQQPVQPVSQQPVLQSLQQPVQPAAQQPVLQSLQQPVQPVSQQPVLSVQQPLVQPVQQPFPQNLQYYPPVPQPMYYYYVQPPQYQPPISQPPQPHLQTLRQAALPPTQPPQPQQIVSQAVTRSQNRSSLQERLNDATLTINERLELFLKYEYPRVWFTSQDVQQHYERVYGNIKLSTVSTYLSRMYSRKLLERRGNRTQREYKYIADESSENENAGYVAVGETIRI